MEFFLDEAATGAMGPGPAPVAPRVPQALIVVGRAGGGRMAG